jgi:hypothetical protein
MDKPHTEQEYIHTFRTSDLPKDVMSKHIARLRPWTYAGTFTYQRAFANGTTRKRTSHWVLHRDSLAWAARCQRQLGRDFEYVLVPETPDPDEPGHLHGLVYVEGGASAKVRELLNREWFYGNSKLDRVERMLSGFKLARYALKDAGFGLDDGEGNKMTIPIFASRSLDDDLDDLFYRQSPKGKDAKAREKASYREMAHDTGSSETSRDEPLNGSTGRSNARWHPSFGRL